MSNKNSKSAVKKVSKLNMAAKNHQWATGHFKIGDEEFPLKVKLLRDKDFNKFSKQTTTAPKNKKEEIALCQVIIDKLKDPKTLEPPISAVELFEDWATADITRLVSFIRDVNIGIEGN